MQRPPRRRTRKPRPKGPMGRLLISPDFALLWLKQSVTALCDALFITTLIIWIGTHTNSPLALGLALLALGAPYALSGPFAEAATERWSRRRTMFVADVVRGTLTFLLAVPLLPAFPSSRRSLAAIYLLCFFIGLMMRFSTAAQRSALTAVVPPRERARGVSRIQGSVAIMSIIGPILAATCFVFLGPTPIPALVITGFLLLLSAGGAQAMDRQFTAKVRAIQARRLRRAAGPDGEPLDEDDPNTSADEEADDAEEWSPSVLHGGIADGFKGVRLVLQQRPFAIVAIVVALIAFVGGALNVLEVFFVSASLGRSGAYLGLILSANTAGILLGSVWFRRLDAHLQPTTTFIYAALGMGLATAAFVSSSDFSIALLMAAAMGVANGLALLAAQTVLVETGQHSQVSRLFVGYETMTGLTGVLGILLGGVAASPTTPGTTLKVISGLLILGGLLGWLFLTKLPSRLIFRRKASKAEEDEFAQPYDASEDDEPAEDGPVEDTDDEFDDYEPPDQAQRWRRPPSQQFGHPWSDEQEPDQEDQSEEEPTEHEDEYPDYADQWEPPAPVEEPPLPRRTMRLRPSPWEKPGGFGR